jgi:hypothetical protein
MNEEELIRKLASLARTEKPPRVDVARRVMATLYRSAKQEMTEVRPLAWMAGLSTVAAGLIAVLSYSAWQAATDPLLGIFIDLYWGGLWTSGH